ncbi:hypothetical protein VOLCADRAFT_92719 [Volvox carteri f. nagariensis]|uniref:HECT-type E3 ubiquitin transferase n=1 Tax=Volvox carteri f. nagariensis TaxID=3068 RepID=D8U0C6_VOLCA|nr:uncharacterized protein VOLCADRAFT_92719 [Volvox carteri f. nagariensis]EFJ46838.1 hypothetical protein VOLCADRAFT_92719 [Volvox carteri f. nagariensis]|eukprot:XP_002952047.1 hypothetical protein VOLCADRAFT_92719 [Volvox carteri f. nagariensis]
MDIGSQHPDAPVLRPEVYSGEPDPELLGLMLSRLQGRPMDFMACARDTPPGKDGTCTLYLCRCAVVELPYLQPALYPAAANQTSPSASMRSPAASSEPQQAQQEHQQHQLLQAAATPAAMAEQQNPEPRGGLGAAAAATAAAATSSSIRDPVRAVCIELVGNRFLRRMVRVLGGCFKGECLEVTCHFDHVHTLADVQAALYRVAMCGCVNCNTELKWRGVAWPELPVRGLIQRFLSNCGLDMDPDAVELHLDRYLLPPTSRFGAVVTRWHRPVGAHDVVRLKALVHRHAPGKARAKLDARGPPRHTVRQVAGRAVAAMATSAGPTRLQSIVSAAAEMSLLPYTFTNWTEAWDHSLMKVAVLLFRTLLPDRPSAASSLMQACSDLLDLPSDFAPCGSLYRGLCTLQLHVNLLQAANELKAAGLGATGVPAPTATREARQLESALEAMKQLLDKAAVHVGMVLEQLSYFGSELSSILDSYLPPPVPVEPLLLPGAPGASGGGVSGGGGGGGGGAAAARVSGGPCGAAAAPCGGGRDLRLQVAELLEPYAAMQLLEAFGRMAVAGYPTGAPPPLLPTGTLPAGWDCHRSLFHAVLDLAAQAGVRIGPPEWAAAGSSSSGGGGGGAEEGLLPSHGWPGTPGGGGGGGPTPTLELPLVASMLDALLQLHVQAHSQCGGGGGGGGGGGNRSGGDWLQDVTSVLAAVCDVYALAGGGMDIDAEAEADLSPVAAAAAPASAAADGGGGLAAAAAAAAALPISAMASATVAAAVGASAIAAVATVESTRLGGVAGPSAAAAAGGGSSLTWVDSDAAATSPLTSSPGPSAPRTPQPGGSGGAGCSTPVEQFLDLGNCGSGDVAGRVLSQADGDVPSEQLLPKAAATADGPPEEDEEDDDRAFTPAATPQLAAPPAVAVAAAGSGLKAGAAIATPAAAYYKQALDELLKPLSYVYDEDDFDAPVVYVDRADMLGSSFAGLMDVEEWLDHEGICVKFEDEEAYGDGVLREWLTEIASSVFDPNAGLFRLCEGDVRALHLSAAGSQQDDQLELLRFAGRIIALCLTFVASCGQLGSAHEVSLLPGGAGEDVAVTAANRRDYLQRLVRFYCTWGCSSRHGKVMAATEEEEQAQEQEDKTRGEAEAEAEGGPDAEAEAEAGGGGRKGAGDGGGGGGSGAEDWQEYELDAVTALAQGLAESLFRMPDEEEDDRVQQLAARLRGISAAAFNSRLGGEVGGIDVEAWRNHSSAPAFKSDREQAVLKVFWEVVSELSAEEQRRLLQFWTGLSHLPAGGFKHLSQHLQLLRVPLLPDRAAMRQAVVESLANLGAFWDE